MLPRRLRPGNEPNIGMPSGTIMTSNLYPSLSKSLDDLIKRPKTSLPRLPNILSTRRTQTLILVDVNREQWHALRRKLECNKVILVACPSRLCLAVRSPASCE
mmetsp:Transcript_3131/g.14635  ORF Transcript_3131/g.14635 Transcript_3131/m.14635 type:complete len:103 (-) Transcript_3131:340-648(-)